MLRIPFAHLITISGFEEDTADSKDAPALLHFDRRLRLFRLRRLHFLSSFYAHRDEQQRAERNCAPGYSLHVWIIHRFEWRAFTGEGKLVRRATGYERKTLKPRYPASGSRPPLERISDPQISPTRRYFEHVKEMVGRKWLKKMRAGPFPPSLGNRSWK